MDVLAASAIVPGMRPAAKATARELARLLSLCAVATQVWLGVSTLYLLVLLWAGRRPLATPSPPRAGEVQVVVLVPAHDEELGVSATVVALRGQEYPAHLLEVIVIADNCSDRTAEVAAAAGATVWARRARDEPGKGQALAWALERLWNERPGTDVVVVIDADCLASVDLVSRVADEIAGAGADAVQVTYQVGNAEQSPAAALRAAGFALKHVVRARGRQRLGLSCGLFGTGMAFSRRLLHDVPWPHSVTEDTELFLRVIESGYRVVYLEHASITTPMPISAADAAQQQLRWETGNALLARGELARMAVTGVRRRRPQMLGAAAELATPSQTLLAFGNLALAVAALAARDRRRFAASGAALAGQLVYVVGGLAAAPASGASVRAFRHLPAFIAARLSVLVRVASGHGARTWVRTSR